MLNEEGTYRLYDLQGDYQQFSLGAEAIEVGIIDARIHENGLVAMTGGLGMLEVKGWQGAKPLSLAATGWELSFLRLILICSLACFIRIIRTSSYMDYHSTRPDYLSTYGSPSFNRIHRSYS